MNKEFETIVMNAYAELCIMWRVAHVTNQTQADDFNTKLQALEGVVAAFDLNTPEGEEIPMPVRSEAPAAVAASTIPAQPASTIPAAETIPSSLPPARSELPTSIPPAPTEIPAAEDMVLED